MATSAAVELLGAAKYVRLTTFRRDGTGVPTPVWVVRDGDRLLVTTGATAGKVKRLAHTPRVLLVPCDARGRVAEGAVEHEASAVVVQDAARQKRLNTLLIAKYGLLARVLLLSGRMRRRGESVCLEISAGA